jgi:hypothetical protein
MAEKKQVDINDLISNEKVVIEITRKGSREAMKRRYSRREGRRLAHLSANTDVI